MIRNSNINFFVIIASSKNFSFLLFVHYSNCPSVIIGHFLGSLIILLANSSNKQKISKRKQKTVCIYESLIFFQINSNSLSYTTTTYILIFMRAKSSLFIYLNKFFFHSSQEKTFDIIFFTFL